MLVYGAVLDALKWQELREIALGNVKHDSVSAEVAIRELAGRASCWENANHRADVPPAAGVTIDSPADKIVQYLVTRIPSTEDAANHKSQHSAHMLLRELGRRAEYCNLRIASPGLQPTLEPGWIAIKREKFHALVDALLG